MYAYNYIYIYTDINKNVFIHISISVYTIYIYMDIYKLTFFRLPAFTRPEAFNQQCECSDCVGLKERPCGLILRCSGGVGLKECPSWIPLALERLC